MVEREKPDYPNEGMLADAMREMEERSKTHVGIVEFSRLFLENVFLIAKGSSDLETQFIEGHKLLSCFSDKEIEMMYQDVENRLDAGNIDTGSANSIIRVGIILASENLRRKLPSGKIVEKTQISRFLGRQEE